MPNIVCGVAELMQVRVDGIRTRLRRVSDEHLHVEPRPSGGRFEFTARHGAGFSVNRREWMFPSKADSVECQYRELWIPVGPQEQFYRFENVQFQLLQYRRSDGSHVEIVAFHWHLRQSSEGSDLVYNQRPHLHLKVAPVPLQNSHLGATLGVGIEEQGSVDYLDRLLDDAARMFANEVLHPLASTPLVLPR